ncbi:hypothetical protein AAMO2058_001432000 [Amorphochlora amoebiformis]
MRYVHIEFRYDDIRKVTSSVLPLLRVSRTAKMPPSWFWLRSLAIGVSWIGAIPFIFFPGDSDGSFLGRALIVGMLNGILHAVLIKKYHQISVIQIPFTSGGIMTLCVYLILKAFPHQQYISFLPSYGCALIAVLLINIILDFRKTMESLRTLILLTALMFILACGMGYTIAFGFYFGTLEGWVLKSLACAFYPIGWVVIKGLFALVIWANPVASKPTLEILFEFCSVAAAALPYRVIFIEFENWADFLSIIFVEITYKFTKYVLPFTQCFTKTIHFADSIVRYLYGCQESQVTNPKGDNVDANNVANLNVIQESNKDGFDSILSEKKDRKDDGFQSIVGPSPKGDFKQEKEKTTVVQISPPGSAVNFPQRVSTTPDKNMSPTSPSRKHKRTISFHISQSRKNVLKELVQKKCGIEFFFQSIVDFVDIFGLWIILVIMRYSNKGAIPLIEENAWRTLNLQYCLALFLEGCAFFGAIYLNQKVLKLENFKPVEHAQPVLRKHTLPTLLTSMTILIVIMFTVLNPGKSASLVASR